MIQFTFDSIAKIMPEWEKEQERFIFRLATARVCRNEALHERMDAIGAKGLDGVAANMAALHYDGDPACQVRMSLELPKDVRQDLANRANDLVGENQEEG